MCAKEARQELAVKDTIFKDKLPSIFFDYDDDGDDKMELPRGLPAKPCQLALELPCPRLCLVIFISSIVIVIVIIKEIIIILVIILLSISSSG